MAIPFPVIDTERLFLRQINLLHVKRVHHFRSDKEINKFIKRPPQTEEMTIEYIKMIRAELQHNKSITWGIMLRDSEALIGSICLWNISKDKQTAEVGYALDAPFHGKGFMGEALKAVLEYGFKQRGFKTIEAYTDYRNIASKKLLKQHGFIPNKAKKDTDNQYNEVFYLNY